MQSPERFTVGDTVRSIRDLGQLALDTVLDIVAGIDTRAANAINNDEDEQL